MGAGTQTHEGQAPGTRPGHAVRGDERRHQGWAGWQEQAQSGWESQGHGATGYWICGHERGTGHFSPGAFQRSSAREGLRLGKICDLA